MLVPCVCWQLVFRSGANSRRTCCTVAGVPVPAPVPVPVCQRLYRLCFWHLELMVGWWWWFAVVGGRLVVVVRGGWWLVGGGGSRWLVVGGGWWSVVVGGVPEAKTHLLHPWRLERH